MLGIPSSTTIGEYFLQRLISETEIVYRVPEIVLEVAVIAFKTGVFFPNTMFEIVLKTKAA